MIPALEVAIAGKPPSSKTRALGTSQALGRIRIFLPRWSSRNSSAFRVWSFITIDRPHRMEERLEVPVCRECDTEGRVRKPSGNVEAVTQRSRQGESGRRQWYSRCTREKRVEWYRR